MLLYSRYSRSIITLSNVVIFMVSLEVATTLAFTWQPVISICRHSPASMAGSTHPSLSGSARYTACTYTDDRRMGARGRCRRGGVACLMGCEYCEPVSSFDPLGMGEGYDTARFNHEAPIRRLQRETCSNRVSRRVVRGFGETALTAIKVPIDDLGVNVRDQGLVEGGDGVLGQKVGATDDYKSSPDEKSPSPKGWEYWGYRAILLAVAAIWGTNFPAVKFVENQTAVPDATAAFVRFAIAAGAMLPFADWRESEVLLAAPRAGVFMTMEAASNPPYRQVSGACWTGRAAMVAANSAALSLPCMEIGIWVSIGYITQAIGLQTSDASLCAFLCSLTVVFVPLINTICGKGIKLVTVASSLIALLGTGFLELGDAHSSWNDLWCVAQAAGFGVAFTRIESSMYKYPGKSLQLSIGQMLSVAGIMCLWCAYSCGGQLPDFSFLKDSSIAAALGYTGLVTTSLAIWLETVALEHVPAAEMSVIFSTEPLWATLVSVAFLGERMGPNGAIGAAFILLACLTAQSELILELMDTGSTSGNDKGKGERLLEENRKENEKGGGNEGMEDGDDAGETFPLSVLDELEAEMLLELEKSSVISSVSVLDEFVVTSGIKTPS